MRKGSQTDGCCHLPRAHTHTSTPECPHNWLRITPEVGDADILGKSGPMDVLHLPPRVLYQFGDYQRHRMAMSSTTGTFRTVILALSAMQHVARVVRLYSAPCIFGICVRSNRCDVTSNQVMLYGFLPTLLATESGQTIKSSHSCGSCTVGLSFRKGCAIWYQ